MSSNITRIYSPYIGDTSDPTDPVLYSETTPTLTKQPDVVFSYPVVSPTLTLTLKTPEFGNRDRLQFDRILRELRGGGFNIFADPEWPRRQVLVLQFVAVKNEQEAEVLTFLETTVAQQMSLRDWENRTWHGYIMNPDTPLIKNRKYGFDISVEFEGELQ